MPRKSASVPSIVGDVPIDQVAVNSKGGSLSAILKRSIRGDLTSGADYFGAKMEFGPGVSAVLVAPMIKKSRGRADPGRFRVVRVSRSRYVVDFEENNEEVIDPVTKATLELLEEMLKAGKLKLLGKDEVKDRLNKLNEEGNAEVEEVRRKIAGNKPDMK